MGALSEIAERIRSIPEERLIREIIEERTEEIEDLNTSQMDQGIDGLGMEITPFYTPFTVRMKKAKGQEPDFVTLKDTGNFHDSLMTEISTDSFKLGAKDPKTKELTDKYGEEIFGLTEENQEEFKSIVRDELEEKLRMYLL